MRNVIIIGSDSFIARKFIANVTSGVSLKLISRVKTNVDIEIVTPDFFDLQVSDFEETDVVMNFAAIVHQPRLKDIALYQKINTELPIFLAKQCKIAGVKHFVQMSTLAVYGDLSFYEAGTTKFNPESVYGRTKLDADMRLQELVDDDFKVSIVRLPMAYGGGVSPGNMQKLIRFALKGVPLPFKGVKNQRDFIHVRNLVQALQIIVDQRLYGVLIPTDKQRFSTEDIINFVDIYSSKKVRKMALPSFAMFLLKKIKPNLYKKVFGDSKVVCNMPDVYQPMFSLEDGVEDIVQGIEKS